MNRAWRLLNAWKRGRGWPVVRDQRGVVFIEALISIVFILYIALAVGQMFMVFHATMAARSAAMRSARAVALDPGLQVQAASGPYRAHQAGYIASLSWPAAPDCRTAGQEVVCSVSLGVPTFLPGGAMFFGAGLSGEIVVTESGRYPVIRG